MNFPYPTERYPAAQQVPQQVPVEIPTDVETEEKQTGDHAYTLVIRQQPQHARVAQGKEKADRKPIDPPPILQLQVHPDRDPGQNFLQSPYLFMSCHLTSVDSNNPTEIPTSALLDSVVSSLQKLKDTDNRDGGFFVFGDVSVKVEGEFRLQFTLYELGATECIHIASIKSKPFKVHPPKAFPGMAESTFLTRSFSDQGVRLRLRKDSRTMTTRKRNSAAARLSESYHSNRNQRQRVGPYDSPVHGHAAHPVATVNTSIYPQTTIATPSIASLATPSPYLSHESEGGHWGHPFSMASQYPLPGRDRR